MRDRPVPEPIREDVDPHELRSLCTILGRHNQQRGRHHDADEPTSLQCIFYSVDWSEDRTCIQAIINSTQRPARAGSSPVPGQLRPARKLANDLLHVGAMRGASKIPFDNAPNIATSHLEPRRPRVVVTGTWRAPKRKSKTGEVQ